jgi:hypothetical protein
LSSPHHYPCLSSVHPPVPPSQLVPRSLQVISINRRLQPPTPRSSWDSTPLNHHLLEVVFTAFLVPMSCPINQPCILVSTRILDLMLTSTPPYALAIAGQALMPPNPPMPPMPTMPDPHYIQSPPVMAPAYSSPTVPSYQVSMFVFSLQQYLHCAGRRDPAMQVSSQMPGTFQLQMQRWWSSTSHQVLPVRGCLFRLYKKDLRTVCSFRIP